MLSRRLFVVTLPLACLSSPARATRALRDSERDALVTIRTQTTQEVSRLQALTADHLLVAEQLRSGNSTRANDLTTLATSLRAGVELLTRANAAFPEVVRQNATPFRAQITPIGPGAPRAGVTLRPSVTPAAAPPTFEDVVARTRFGMQSWARIAETLLFTERETGLVFATSGRHYRSASTQFLAANVVLRRLDRTAAFRNELLDRGPPAEDNDRLGNFELQDLMGRMNQSETLRSNVLKDLDDARSTLLRNIGG